MNARKSRVIRKMTKAKHGNSVWRRAKRNYVRQPHNDKSVRGAVIDALNGVSH